MMFRIYFLLTFFVPSLQLGAAQHQAQHKDSLIKSKANYYYTTGKLLSEKSDFEQSEIYFDSLYTYAKANNLVEFELLGLMSKGVFLRKRGELEQALNTYYKVLERSKNVSPSSQNERTQIMTLQNMGTIYGETGMYDKAIATLKEALALAEKQKDNNYVRGAILSNIANSYSSLEDYAMAITYQQQVLDIGKKVSNDFLIVHSLAALSEDYSHLGEYTKALQFARHAETKNKPLDISRRKVDWIYLHKGVAFKGLKQLDSSKYYLLMAKEAAIQKKNQVVEMGAEEHLAQVYEQLKDFKNAQEAQKRYTALKTASLDVHKSAAILATERENESRLQQEIAIRNRNVSYIIGLGLLLTIIFGALFLYNLRKRKKIEQSNAELRADYHWIAHQYTSLKESLHSLTKEKEKKDAERPDKYQKSSLSKIDRENFTNTILEYMEADEPYLNPNLSQSELAKSLGIKSHHLSEVLALSFEKNFNNFINIYRINKAQELLKSSDYKNFKIEAIAYEAGFNSKTSFNRVFKDITGKTPSEYRSIK